MRNSSAKKQSVFGADFNVVLGELQKDTKGFERLATLLKDLAGIHLPTNDKNLSLMAGRLNPVLRKLELSSYAEYVDLLAAGDAELIQEFVSSLTTNTTEFFRENNHFTVMKDLLTQIMARKAQGQSERELRVWCSASSTGQEPYTILMTILETLGSQGRFNLKMLATDIDTEALARAQAGTYSQVEMKNIPPQLVQKYFDGGRGSNGQYQVKNEYRSLIRFAPFNLLTPKYPFQFPFDIVFCRNVLIYFDRQTSAAVIHKLGSTLGKDGYLFLGHSEAGMVRNDLLQPVANAVYKRVKG